MINLVEKTGIWYYVSVVENLLERTRKADYCSLIENGARALQGIVLALALFFYIFIKNIAKIELNPKSKKKITVILCLSIFFMISFIIYSVSTQSTLMFVRETAIENLFSEDTISKAESIEESHIVNTPERRVNITEYLRSVLSFAWDNRDIITGGFIVIIGIFIYFFRDKIVFAPYRDYLKEQLYKLNHCWLNGQSLKNLLVSVSVWHKNINYEEDICKYFLHELEKSSPGMYIILGNPGEGKTVSIRKLSQMLLDTGYNISPGKKRNIFYRMISVVKRSIGLLGSTTYIPVIFNIIDIKKIGKAEELENEIKNIVFDKSKILKLIKKSEQIKKRTYRIIEKSMGNGKFVFFFDGLDEISENSSYYLEKTILELQEKFPKCFYIFSSRTAVFYERSCMHFDNEKILNLLPFSKEKILTFLKKWQFKSESACWNLYERILYNYQLERLAGNPLLLTLIAYLYEHSELHDPESTADFYEKAMICLLDKWEGEKKIPKRTKIDLEIKYIFLETAAFWLFENEETFFKKLDIFKVSYSLIQYGISLDTVFDEIYPYSGILEKTKDDSFKFYHRSFYEYFLARYLVRNKVDVLNNSRYTSNFQIMFFYLSLNGDSTITERYIQDYLHEESLIDSIILECRIDNPGIIRYYLLKKKWNKKRDNEEYYTVLGWIAEKYSYLKRQIYRDLLNELLEAIRSRQNRQLVYILQAFSRFMSASEIADLIESYLPQIDILNFAQSSRMQLEPCIIELFFRPIQNKYKSAIISGLCMAHKYNTIVSILNKKCCDNDLNIIFFELLFETKDKLFIQWFDNLNVWKYIDEPVIKQVKRWEKTYGWRWNPEDVDLRRKRYLMVYYLLNNAKYYTDNDNTLRKQRISNRIKFVASYIKNMENSYSKVQSFFIDIPHFQIISNEEFRIHWKKSDLREELFFNPTVINMIQWIVSLLVLMAMCIYFLKFRSDATAFQDYLYRVMQVTLEENPDLFDQINRLVRFENLYNIQVSEYLTMNANMFIFYTLWIFFQIKTYKELIRFPFSRRIIILYIAICCAYLIGFTYIFSDLVFRACGGIIAMIILLFALVQHRRNMPSFMQPQFDNIRNYLEKDAF